MKKLPTKKIKDIRGKRFGRLIVKSFSHIANNKGRNAYWNCACDCGNFCCVSSGPLRTGDTKSCGCLAKEISRDLIKKTHNKGKHLYFIKCGPFIKIGRADKPSLRLNQIQTNNPYDCKLVHVAKNKGPQEKFWHLHFKECHHSGEWFKLDVCEIVDIGKDNSNDDG